MHTNVVASSGDNANVEQEGGRLPTAPIPATSDDDGPVEAAAMMVRSPIAAVPLVTDKSPHAMTLAEIIDQSARYRSVAEDVRLLKLTLGTTGSEVDTTMAATPFHIGLGITSMAGADAQAISKEGAANQTICSAGQHTQMAGAVFKAVPKMGWRIRTRRGPFIRRCSRRVSTPRWISTWISRTTVPYWVEASAKAFGLRLRTVSR